MSRAPSRIPSGRRSALSRRPLSREDLDKMQLPDEVLEVVSAGVSSEEDESSPLSRLSQVIAGKRDEARDGRKASGIEAIWTRAEEAYAAIDDMNRGSFSSGRWEKPMSPVGPITTGKGPISNTRSSVFIPMTRRYVDAGSAKLAEVLLPADDKSFSFSETPVPDLIAASEDDRRVLKDDGTPLYRKQTKEETAQGGMPPTNQTGPGPAAPASPAAVPPAQVPTPGVPPTALAGGAPPTVSPPPGVAAPASTAMMPPNSGMVPLTVRDLAKENIEIARKAAKKAEERVFDWMVETRYSAEVRKIIKDSARLGVGVLKGPVPVSIKSVAIKKGSGKDGKKEVFVEEKVVPACIWVDPWNFYPDTSCGEFVKNGQFCLEKDTISERQLEEFKAQPGYIVSQIERVMEEGPDKAYTKAREEGTPVDAAGGSLKNTKYEVWYFYGTITREEMNCLCEASGDDQIELDDEEDDKKLINIIATLINDSIVRAVQQPLDSGRCVYHTFPWSRRSGNWAGIGVAEQLFDVQKMLNGAIRAMMNNAGKSAGSQIVVDTASIRPLDGVWEVTPDKLWGKSGENAATVKDAFELYKIQNVTNEIMIVVNLANQLAEESTSIPLISQGQSGPNSPDTLGGMQLQNNNANQLVRDIGYSFDDHITEPVTLLHYEWLLLDEDVPDEEKGDFQIDAHGSVALVERSIQDQFTMQLLPLVANPQNPYRADPKKVFAEVLRTKKLDPEKFQYTPEEITRLDSAPPVKDPRVQAAEIMAQSSQAVAGIRADTDLKDTHVNATVDLHDLSIREKLAMLDYANRHSMNLDQVQAKLAEVTLKLKAEVAMNHQNNSAAPEVQVPGRAAPGHALDQTTRPEGNA